MTNTQHKSQASCLQETGNSEVIRVLNKARAMEMYAVSQYMDQHFSLVHKDYGELAANIKLISIDEMRHAEQLGERFKELGGEPSYDQPTAVVKKQETEIMFSFDACVEKKTMDAYNKFKAVCIENNDSASAGLFEKLIEAELAHHTYFSNVAGHMENLGDIYLSKMAGTPSSTGEPSKGFVAAG